MSARDLGPADDLFEDIPSFLAWRAERRRRPLRFLAYLFRRAKHARRASNLTQNTRLFMAGVTVIAACVAAGTIVSLVPASATTPVAPLGATGIASADAAKDYSSDANGLFPVDPASGDFWHTFTDVSIPGYGPSLDLTRTYNSLEASTEGPFGYGWVDSYGMSYNTSTTTLTMADGSRITLTGSGGSYTVPGLADSTFVANSNGTYSFDDQQTDTYVFNSSGQLQSITDTNGDATTLAYNGSGELTTVTDPAGRTLTFGYNASGLVAFVTDPMGRETQYGYDGSGNLTSVTDPLGNVTTFAYDASHLMTSLTFPNGQSGGPDAGKSVTNTYDSSGRPHPDRPDGL